MDLQLHEEGANEIANEVAVAAGKRGLDPLLIPTPNLILMLTQRFAIAAKANPEEFKMRMLIMKNTMPTLYGEVYNNLKELNLISADLQPDMEIAQKTTPGELPTYNQGGVSAEAPPSIAEVGANLNLTSTSYDKALPEARPPVSQNAPI